MNREAVMIRAMADVVKERLERQDRRVKTIDATMLVPEFTNQIAPPDFGPLTEALDRFAAREIPAPHVNVESPNIEIHPKYEFSPRMDAPVINVSVDMTPVAQAIQKQTECLEKLFGKILTCLEKGLDKGKEIEIIKDSAGRITGARRK